MATIAEPSLSHALSDMMLKSTPHPCHFRHLILRCRQQHDTTHATSFTSCKGTFTPDPARRVAAPYGAERHGTALPSPLTHWNFPYALHCTAVTHGTVTHRTVGTIRCERTLRLQYRFITLHYITLGNF